MIGSFDTDWSSPSGGHRVALAFDCIKADDVDRIFSELVEAGCESKIEPWDTVSGMRSAGIHDLDVGPSICSHPHDEPQ